MDNLISSIHNPKIKKLLALQQKSSMRKKEGLFVVEGQRELTHCLNAGYVVDSLFYCESMVSEDALAAVSSSIQDTAKLFIVTPEVYEKIAYRGTTEGFVAEIVEQKTTLSDLALSDNPLLMVVERVEKPGNLGAILRSADAAAADAVIVCDPLTDLYNPNLIRSSIGAIFTVPCVACSSEECISFLHNRNISILTAQLQDSRAYYDTNMRQGVAIVMGTESTGLTDIWRKAADAHIRIPMLGKLDSLNVSVSAAVLLYEAVRQRQVANGE